MIARRTVRVRGAQPHDRADHRLRAVPRRAGQRHHAAAAGAGAGGAGCFPTCASSPRCCPPNGLAAPRRLGSRAGRGAARPRPALRRLLARPRLRDRAARAQRLRGRCRMRRASCRGPPRCATAAPSVCAASLPVRHIVTRLRRLGIPAFVSRDAGAYLCNAALYHSLVCATDRPPPAAASASCTSRRRWPVPAAPTAAAPAPARSRGTRPVVGALEILAACLGRPSALRST